MASDGIPHDDRIFPGMVPQQEDGQPAEWHDKLQRIQCTLHNRAYPGAEATAELRIKAAPRGSIRLTPPLPEKRTDPDVWDYDCFVGPAVYGEESQETFGVRPGDAGGQPQVRITASPVVTVKAPHPYEPGRQIESSTAREAITRTLAVRSVPSMLTVCQLSDIHFGKHANYVSAHGPSLVGPALKIGEFLRSQDIEPDYYVVCGDIASSKGGDFADLRKCLRNLPLPKGARMEDRVLVVPGNHDNFWRGLSTDRLRAFRKHMVTTLHLPTPFGRASTPDCIGATVSAGCPAAVWLCGRHQVMFLLLTSCYYTGDVEARIAGKLSKVADRPVRAELADRLRLERGFFHPQYVQAVNQLLADARDTLAPAWDDLLKIAVTHHHLRAEGTDPAATVQGKALTRRLSEHGFRYILHGHIHRPWLPARGGADSVQVVSSPSLGGQCPGHLNGFNILRFTHPGDGRLEAHYYAYEGEEFAADPRPLPT